MTRAAWYSRRSASATKNGSPPISRTSVSATARCCGWLVTPKGAPISRSASSGVPENVMAGCSASGSTPGQLRGREHGEAVRAGGVEGQLAAPPGAGLRQARDEPGQGVVGNGEDDQVGGGDDLVGRQQRDAGQQARGPLGGGGGQARGGDHVVAGGGERGAQDGADPAGAHDAHAEAGGSGGGGGADRQRAGSCGEQASVHLSFQSLSGTGRREWPPPLEVTGSCWSCGGAVLRWRRPAATGCVAQVDRRRRVCDRRAPPATCRACGMAHPRGRTPRTGRRRRPYRGRNHTR